MRFSTAAGVAALLLTVTASAAQNLPAPMSTDRVPPGSSGKALACGKEGVHPESAFCGHRREREHTNRDHGHHHGRGCDRVNLEVLGPEGDHYPQAAEAPGLHRLSVSKVRGRRASRLTEMCNRLAATELPRFETDLGPNQLKECCGPRVWRLVGAMSELSKAGQCPIANDVEPLQTRD
jgi:hypothetical protein